MAYCGDCGQKVYGELWYRRNGLFGGFGRDAFATYPGEYMIALCQGGHYFAWTHDGEGNTRTASWPAFRVGGPTHPVSGMPEHVWPCPTVAEILAALGLSS